MWPSTSLELKSTVVQWAHSMGIILSTTLWIQHKTWQIDESSVPFIWWVYGLMVPQNLLNLQLFYHNMEINKIKTSWYNVQKWCKRYDEHPSPWRHFAWSRFTSIIKMGWWGVVLASKWTNHGTCCKGSLAIHGSKCWGRTGLVEIHSLVLFQLLWNYC